LETETIRANYRTIAPTAGQVEVVILAVAVRYCIVPVVGDGTFGEVSELRLSAGVGLKAGGRRRAPHNVQTDLNGGVDVRDFLAGEGVEAGMIGGPAERRLLYTACTSGRASNRSD
jgi:hypothetical protein